MHIGKIIRERRVALGLSQSDVATMVKVSPAFVANIERGAERLPPGRLPDFSRALDIDLAEEYNQKLSYSAKLTLDFLNGNEEVSEKQFWIFIDGLRQ